MEDVRAEAKPLISIALCTYNGARFLREQLDSLVNQSYPNMELVAVDDGSTDATPAILEEYAQRYPFMRVYANGRNLGLSRNFERALTLCRGSYIAVADQDDVWLLDKIELMLNAIGSNLLVYAHSSYIDEQGNALPPGKECWIPYTGSDPRLMILVNFTWGHKILFRRSLLDYALPLPAGVDYDWHLGLMALNYGRVAPINRSLVKHRYHNANATKKRDKPRPRQDRLLELHSRLGGVVQTPALQHRAFFEKMYKLSNPQAGPLTHARLCLMILSNRKLLYHDTKSFFSHLNLARKYLF